MIENNPAVAAAIAGNAAAGEGHFLGDPFRAPHRWGGRRGSYELTTYVDRAGSQWSAALFGPLDVDAAPHPGVLLVCHACPLFPTTEGLSAWYWAAETLAEAGYIVMYAAVPGNDVPVTIDATDFFVATPGAPTPHGEFNPWHAKLDRSRLGIVGHAGAGGVALNVGHTDPRYDAVVAWDPAGPSLAGVRPRIATIQVADYSLSSGPVPRTEKPTPAPGSKYTYFDTIRAAGVDAMQVALRSSTHLDWQHFPSDPQRPHSIYGEMVATSYTLAWLGAGFFDADAVERAGNVEAGNVPITIGGLRIRNLLSFHYDSRYFLDGGAMSCDDIRAGCSDRRRLARR